MADKVAGSDARCVPAATSTTRRGCETEPAKSEPGKGSTTGSPASTLAAIIGYRPDPCGSPDVVLLCRRAVRRPASPSGARASCPRPLARARPSRVRSEIRSRSTSANSAMSVVMTFVWMSRLPSRRMFSFERHEGDAGLDERVEDGHDLRRRFRRFLQQRHVSVQTEQMHPAVDTAGDVPRDDLHGSGSQVTEGVLSDAGRFFLHRPTPRSARSRS